jgi:DNA helicase-2/ATP-dependent DNA helicase PcrA
MYVLTSDQISDLKKKIEQEHKDDKEQIDVVFSGSRRLLVEAPAGYGKTKTMVSRLAYLMGTGGLAYPKKALCLTFSVSAAYKIRRDINELLPKYFPDLQMTRKQINNRIFVSNYHGFMRRLLSVYGSPYSPSFKKVEKLSIVNDDNERDLSIQCGLIEKEVHLFKSFVAAVKSAEAKKIQELESGYNEILFAKVLPKGHFTYNGILLTGLRVLQDNAQVLSHYRHVYSHLIVDEFQDTNLLSWRLLKLLHNDSMEELFLGDALQRIYGFIGAVPNLLHIAQNELALTPIMLRTNHRFEPGTLMHGLDRLIRRVAESPANPKIDSIVKVPVKFCGNQTQESDWVAKTVQGFLDKSDEKRVAILVRWRSQNADQIYAALEKSKIKTFWALFTEEEATYIKFHQIALKCLNETIKAKGLFGQKSIRDFHAAISRELGEETDKTTAALSELLDAFLQRTLKDSVGLQFEEKVFIIEDCLVNRSLRQNMQFLNHRVSLVTAHGSKGLEWDHVILPDMEKDQFPAFFALCNDCAFQRTCDNKVIKDNQEWFLAELSTFYVATTRAKEDLVFSSSKIQSTKRGPKETNLSCFLRLPGMTIEKLT